MTPVQCADTRIRFSWSSWQRSATRRRCHVAFFTAELPISSISPGQDVKHLFDAVSYPIAMRLIDQLSDTPGPRVVSDRRMISVR
jgi:hypothetical protein